jgi:hypothetical protein
MPRKPNSQLDGLPLAAVALAEGRLPRDIAFRFLDPESLITFSGDATKGNRFLMSAYSGKTFPHPWWGTVAIDLKGLRASGQKMPTLREHMRDRIVGFTESVTIDGTVQVEGSFSQSSPDGQQVKALADEGFPWQASMGLDFATTEFVREGSVAEVNGLTLKGPGTIFRKGMIREVSFAALGADPRTSAEAFSAADPASRDSVIAAFSYVPEQEVSMNEPKTPEPKASETPITAAAPKPPAPAPEPTPTPAPSAAAFSRADAESMISKGIQDGLKALKESRRARAEKLRPIAFSNQEQLLEDLIDSDKPIEECALALVKDYKEKGGARLSAIQRDPAAGVLAGYPGTAPSALEASEKDLVTPQGNVDEVKAKAKFAASPDLQVEFGSEGAFIAFLRTTARGSHHFRLLEGGREAS